MEVEVASSSRGCEADQTAPAESMQLRNLGVHQSALHNWGKVSALHFDMPAVLMMDHAATDSAVLPRLGVLLPPNLTSLWFIFLFGK
jgi:hypothetical protein